METFRISPQPAFEKSKVTICRPSRQAVEKVVRIFACFVKNSLMKGYLSRSRHRTTNFPNLNYFVCLLFYLFFCETHFFEARLEKVIDGVADCWSYF